MKIVFTCDTMGSGGAERSISTLSNQFVDLGHEVCIIMVSHSEQNSFYELNEKIDLIPLLKGLSKRPRYFNRARLLRKRILFEKPDIVISFLTHVSVYTFLSLRGTNIPFVVSERSDPTRRSIFRKILVKITYRNANGCVFQTTDAMKWYGKKISKKSIVIYNPVHLTYIPNKASLKRNKTIISVGRFVDEKNYFFLIDAFKLFLSKHEDYLLKIYGEGILKDAVQNYIKENGLETKVIVCNNSKNWHRDECNSCMFVLGSKHEGMPNALEEALCLGIPSVSTNCPIGGPKELKTIFKDSLLLSEVNDIDSFVFNMEQIIISNNRIVGIPKCLTKEYIAQKWLNYIKKIINR